MEWHDLSHYLPANFVHLNACDVPVDMFPVASIHPSLEDELGRCQRCEARRELPSLLARSDVEEDAGSIGTVAKILRNITMPYAGPTGFLR